MLLSTEVHFATQVYGVQDVLQKFALSAQILRCVTDTAKEFAGVVLRIVPDDAVCPHWTVDFISRFFPAETAGLRDSVFFLTGRKIVKASLFPRTIAEVTPPAHIPQCAL
ncbi:hypothetical protein KOR42_31610 [Thalassoglobus neptunius]|uniref:Uncharacterized protein n=1 Tax=Thalassoglobus neptunius TaxID=1938619 RepID=A0A5C5WMM1_9PLAN|nr:hypothetical protein KOR42_31610 [Thalassoglobus neptunius]